MSLLDGSEAAAAGTSSHGELLSAAASSSGQLTLGNDTGNISASSGHTAGEGIETSNEVKCAVDTESGSQDAGDVRTTSADRNDKQQAKLPTVDGVQMSACADSVSKATHSDKSHGDETDARDVCTSLSNGCEVATVVADRCNDVKTDRATLSATDNDVQLSTPVSVVDVNGVNNPMSHVTLEAAVGDDKRSDMLSTSTSDYDNTECIALSVVIADSIANEQPLHKVDYCTGSAADGGDVLSAVVQQDKICELHDSCDEHLVDKTDLVDHAVDDTGLVEARVDHGRLGMAETCAHEERWNEEMSVKHCANPVVSTDIVSSQVQVMSQDPAMSLLAVSSNCLTDSSPDNVSIDLSSASKSLQSAVDCTSAITSVLLSAARNEQCTSDKCEQQPQVDSGNVDEVTEVVEDKCSIAEDMSCGSGGKNPANGPLATCSSISEANEPTTHAHLGCDDPILNADSGRETLSAVSAVVSSDGQVSSSAAATGHCVSVGSAVPPAQSVTNDSKCLGNHPSLAQTSQFTGAGSVTDVQLRNAGADCPTVKAASETATAADTDNHTTLCSKQRYVTGVDINMSTFCTQPLKSLADLVQKVSVSASEQHLSKKNLLDAESVLDAAAVRNSPLYSGRVNYMTACPAGRSGRAVTGTSVLQQSMEQNSLGHVTGTSEFKKPSTCAALLTCISNVPGRPANEIPDADHNGGIAVAGVHCQPVVDGIKTARTAARKRNRKLSPVTKNLVDAASGDGNLVDGVSPPTDELSRKAGRKERKSAGQGRNRVRKCKVDVVDVKFLKDLIVACGGDGVASSCQIVPDGEAVKTLAKEAEESCQQNESGAAFGVEVPTACEAVQSQLSAKEQKPRKGAAARRKTTKLLSDITLIDVATVKSCVEKDYSEFIKSIQQSPDNKTAVNESKSSKKKKTKTESTKISAVIGEENQKKGCSPKGRQNRNPVDKVSDGCAELNVKSTRSRSKKQQDDVDTLPVDRCHELSTTDGVNSACDDPVTRLRTNEKPHNFAVPNLSLPTSKKNAPRKKKKTGLQKVETEVVRVKDGAETRSHRKATASKTPETSQETVVENKQIVDGLTENSVVWLNTTTDGGSIPTVHDTPVTYANKTKKSKSSKKKSAALLDSGGVVDACQGDTAIDCSTSCTGSGGKSRKRKSQTPPSLTASETLSEPVPKNSKNTASVDDTSLETVNSGADRCEMPSIDVGGTVHGQTLSDNDLKPTQTKDHRQKNKKRKKKGSLPEAVSETDQTTQNKKTNEEDSATKTPTSETVTDEANKSEQVLTAADPIPNSGSTTVADKGQDEVGTVPSDQAEVKQADIEETRQMESSTVDFSTAEITGSSLAAEAAGIEVDADGQKLFTCTRCSYRARKKGQLRKHLSVHKVFICAHCEFSADTQAGLDDHMAVKHPSRCGRRLCKRCHMLFRAGTAFMEHVEQCTGVKLSWQCPTCEKNFKFISAMRTHVHRWHGGDASANNDAATGRELASSTGDTAQVNSQLHTTDAVDTDIRMSSTVISAQSAMPAVGPILTVRPVTIAETVSTAGPVHTAGLVPTTRPVPTAETVPTAEPVPTSGPVPSAGSVPIARPILTAVPVPNVGLVLTAGPVQTASKEPVDTVTAAGSSASAMELSSTLQTGTVLLPAGLVTIANPAVSCASNTEPVNSTVQPSDLTTDVQTIAAKLSSSSSAASTVTIDGELRYMCDHCTKSFKAKRSMVHHRRMIHEGGRLKKLEAAAAAATAAAASAAAAADAAVATNDVDEVKTKLDDDKVTSAERSEVATSEVVNEDVVKTTSSLSQVTEVPVAPAVDVDMSSSSSSAADAAVHPHTHPHPRLHPATGASAVRQVYSCSFVGCAQTFKRAGQLHRHEEKHAGPDNRKFMCDWPDCRKSFLHAENLTSHRRQHTDPKPFRCEECPLAYWQKSSLRSHRLKAHGPAASTQHNVDKSAQLLASMSSAGQLVDGIIKSVSASMQASSSSTANCSNDTDDGNIKQLASVSDSTNTLGRPVSLDGPDVGQEAGRPLSAEPGHEAGPQLTRPGTDEVTERTDDDVIPPRVVDDLLSEQSDVVKDEDQVKTSRSSEPLNVYEFCEDEAVDICRPKPSRSSAAAPRTNTELTQTTIELNNHSDDDDEDHDLMAFDDDMSPTVDRLAETVITYSRKKKQPSTENENATVTISKRLSPSVKPAAKKSSRRKSPTVAGLRRKRTGMAEVQEDTEEPVKKKVRRKRTIDGGGDVDKDVVTCNPLPQTSNLTKQAAKSRNTKRSKKDKTCADGRVPEDNGRSQKSSANDDVNSLSLQSSQSTAVCDGKKRTRKSDPPTKLESHKPSPDRTASDVRNINIDSNNIEKLDMTRDTASADTNTGNQATRRKGKGWRRRTKRQITRKDAEVEQRSKEDGDVGDGEIATADKSLMENVDDSAAGNAGEMEEREAVVPTSSDDERVSDAELTDAGPAAECLSENTEILSLNDNIDDADDAECTRRSSPASYKSEEHEPCVLVPPAQQDDEDSKGSLLDESLETTEEENDVRVTAESAESPMISETLVEPTAVMDTSSSVVPLSVNAAVDDGMSVSYTESTSLVATAEPVYSHTMTDVSTTGDVPMFTLSNEQNSDDYQQSLVAAVTDGGYQSTSTVDDLRPFYQQDDDGPNSSPHLHSTGVGLNPSSSDAPAAASRGFPYTADGLTSSYPLLPARPDGPLQSLEGLAADGASYMGTGVMPSSYADAPRPSLIDSTSSYTMSLPPYPGTEVDQSKLVNRIPSYLPYAATRTAVETQRTIDSPTIYGRSVPPVTPAFPSDAFTKDFFGQYLHESSSGPLHPLATHGTLHDQHAAAAAGILGGYQQASTLPTMPHGGGGSELFRRAYSGVSDNLFGGMKAPAQSTLVPAQSQHWMSSADTPRRWNHTPPSVHPDVSRYNYPPGRTELAETAKSLPPAPAPMSKRPDDVSMMFGSTSSSTVHYPLSGSVYSPPTPGHAPYPHPSLPSAVSSSQRQLEDAYRQMAAGDYRSLAHHRTPSEMYGSALSSLDRYYYTARDAMYRSQQLAAAAMPHPFIPQSSQYPTGADRSGGYGREPLPTYGQCPAPTYGFMCPPGTDKQYLPPSSAAMRAAGDYLDTSGSSQDAYSRHSVIYNMMPRYF